MDVIQAILLGLMQGITEWLPVSSEGQTMLAMISWLGIAPKTALSYSLFMHLGTMFAVIVKFRHMLAGILAEPSSRLTETVIIATIFTGLTGIPLYYLFKDSFIGGREAVLLIGFMLISMGILLRFTASGHREYGDMRYVDMILLGLIQGFSILPGVSRSGTTVTTLLIRNFRPEDALTVSFILSIPAVIGALVLDHSFAAISLVQAISMLLSSFLAGYFSMDLLIRFSRRVNFSMFCLIIGFITVVFGSV